MRRRRGPRQEAPQPYMCSTTIPVFLFYFSLATVLLNHLMELGLRSHVRFGAVLDAVGAEGDLLHD